MEKNTQYSRKKSWNKNLNVQIHPGKTDPELLTLRHSSKINEL